MANLKGIGAYYCAVVALLGICASTATRNDSDMPSFVVCHTEECWSMSTSLHATLDTSANPCTDFEQFICGGFRSHHQLSGDKLVSGMAYLDYMQRSGIAYSERVTEQLATECWDSDCVSPTSAKSAKLRSYEQVAIGALKDCVESNRSLHDMVRVNVFEVLEEVIDLGLEGVMPDHGDPRYESILALQSSKSLLSPLTVVSNVASRDGRPALMIVATEPFFGLQYVSTLLSHFPLQMQRLMRQLRMHMPRSVAGLMRYAQASLQLWKSSCHKTATDVTVSFVDKPVQTVRDAKLLLFSANLTFNLDDFLRLSVNSSVVNDSTDILIHDPVMFLYTVCLLDHSAKRRPDLIKILVMHQVTILAANVLEISSDARCVDELFGVVSSGSSETPNSGAFRPLLHGRYARSYANQAVEAEAKEVFSQLTAAYKAAIHARAWIPPSMKSILAGRLDTLPLKFLRESVSDEYLILHYRNLMDSRPSRGCTLKENPACLLVRARALQMSLAVRSIYLNLDNESPHYDQLRHSVFLTPAFTEPPHYRLGQPLAARLGLLGFVFAHELTHAVITIDYPQEVASGKQQQKQQQLLRLSSSAMDTAPKGWPEAFKSGFRAREQCMRTRLTVKQSLNKTSVAEDIADQIGLSVAYAVLAQSGDATRLPGYMARYTPSQLFYIASLRTFCSKASPGYLERFLTASVTQSHTPGSLRIRSMLAGDANFARTFGCPVKEENSAADSSADQCKFW